MAKFTKHPSPRTQVRDWHIQRLCKEIREAILENTDESRKAQIEPWLKSMLDELERRIRQHL